MSRMNDNIVKAIAWLNENIPDNAAVINENHTIRRNVPLNVSAPYQFFDGSFSGIPVLWVMPKPEVDITPSAIKRHGEIINKACGLLPIFIFENLEAYKTRRLINAHVNLIVKDKAVNLPALLLIIRKQRATLPSQREMRDEIPAAAQLILLYNIQKQPLGGFTIKRLAELFNLSYATIKRAVVWLLDRGVIIQTGRKERAIQFNYEGKALWDYCGKLLRNPVESEHPATDLSVIESYEIAGETALACYTMLSENGTTAAISKKELTRLNRDSKGWDRYGDYRVQTWIYDPKIMSEGGVVDPLSLYLSLKEHYDERVQIELENLMSEIKW